MTMYTDKNKVNTIWLFNRTGLSWSKTTKHNFNLINQMTCESWLALRNWATLVAVSKRFQLFRWINQWIKSFLIVLTINLLIIWVNFCFLFLMNNGYMDLNSIIIVWVQAKSLIRSHHWLDDIRCVAIIFSIEQFSRNFLVFASHLTLAIAMENFEWNKIFFVMMIHCQVCMLAIFCDTVHLTLWSILDQLSEAHEWMIKWVDSSYILYAPHSFESSTILLYSFISWELLLNSSEKESWKVNRVCIWLLNESWGAHSSVLNNHQ